jgi:hypothetical protein
LDERRKLEIAYQMEKLNIRKNFAFRDIADAKRRIGNLVKEPEMIQKNITKEELIEYGEKLVREVFEEQMAKLQSKGEGKSESFKAPERG